jgi:endonuclease/exonuclease/phosphatase family metal-dependent hydrolase
MAAKSTCRALAWCTAIVAVAWSTDRADALRIVTYNILNYNADTLREGHYRTILREIGPDVLVVQEILSQAAVDRFASQVLNHPDGPAGTYAAATFVNGPDTDNALFYRTSAVSFAAGDHLVISTALRNIDRWRLHLVGYSSSGADLYVYSCHLKASQGSTNEQKRLAEAALMRQDAEALPAGSHFIYAGDYNVYRSSEPAYQQLITIGVDPDGQGFDPIDSPGNWHVNPAFAAIHTQSPRTAQFGGGSNGGMDDRFDIMLQSASLDDAQQMSYVPGTYSAFGQDGAHFDVAIIDPPVIPEGAAMATALHEASDHLPVAMDVQVPARLGADLLLDFGMVIVGAGSVQNLAVSNVGDVLTFAFVDELDYSLAVSAGFAVAGGPFQAVAGAGPNLHPVTMDTSVCGLKSGAVEIASDDVDDPLVSVALVGTVLGHARPSVSASTEIAEQALDFGAHAPGEFPTLTAEAHNFAYDSLQASLEVHAAELVGPDAAAFLILGGFVPGSAADSPAQYVLAVDPNLTGYTGGQILAADLILHTRDQQDLAGAADLADLVFHLTAEVGSTCASSDLTGDGKTDLNDFSTLASCFRGTNVTVPSANCAPADFTASDLDGDGDVDLGDFSTFALCFTG